jgi:hypothetical protein
MGRFSLAMANSKVPKLQRFDLPTLLISPRRFTCGFSVHAAADGGRIGQVAIAATDNSALGIATYSVAPSAGDVILDGELTFYDVLVFGLRLHVT